ncbi:MAG: CPBP family intramembrane metalloprotease [Wenzhouxiangella sp.]|nr:MAG: CPBP family intramembrane metalloprotease [Wenzhouxiangella sp.]
MNDSTDPPTRQDRRLPWWIILLGLAIAYSPNFLNRLARLFGADWPWLAGPQSVLVWNWIVVLVLFAFIFLVERRGLQSISLKRPSGRDIQWAVVFWFVSVAVSWLVHMWFPPPPSDGLEIILALSIPVLLLVVITTSVTEEIFYRGYSIERLTELSGSLMLATGISFILFLIPHVAFFGPHWILYQGVSVVLLYVLYVWRRNLWACILMHLLGNLMILFPALGLD